jgi:hypothetical protein
MQRFMFIVRADLAKLAKQTKEDVRSNIKISHDWIRSLEDGKFEEGHPLAIQGRYVSQDEVLADGPFIEAKEGVAGYDIIRASNLEDAVSIAQSHPLVKSGDAVIEIRPFMFDITDLT